MLGHQLKNAILTYKSAGKDKAGNDKYEILSVPYQPEGQKKIPPEKVGILEKAEIDFILEVYKGRPPLYF